MIDCSRRRVFTIDIVRQLAELMKVDNVGDEEIEDVVTSLTPVNHNISSCRMIDRHPKHFMFNLTHGDW